MFQIFGRLFGPIISIPRETFRNRIKLPIIRFIDDKLEVLRTKTRTGIYTTRDVVLKGSILAFITTLLVWLSIFMYLAFYFTYVPSVAHERAVHLKFKPDTVSKPHSYLTAHVELTNRQQLLMLGQPYRIHLDLELPESPANRDMGMFMVCATFRGKQGRLITQSCRSSMLHYRSPLLDVIYTIFYSPMYIFGFKEEAQNLHIELFSNYEEQQGPAVTDVQIEIQSDTIEVYSANFLINAEFSGLRYFMFNRPLISAGLGITANIFVIAIIGIISWYQLIHSEEYKKYVESKQPPEIIQFDEDSYSSSSIEDISLLEKHKSDSEAIEDISSEKTD